MARPRQHRSSAAAPPEAVRAPAMLGWVGGGEDGEERSKAPVLYTTRCAHATCTPQPVHMPPVYITRSAHATCSAHATGIYHTQCTRAHVVHVACCACYIHMCSAHATGTGSVQCTRRSSCEKSAWRGWRMCGHYVRQCHVTTTADSGTPMGGSLLACHTHSQWQLSSVRQCCQ
jgi:hypothetical protein